MGRRLGLVSLVVGLAVGLQVPLVAALAHLIDAAWPVIAAPAVLTAAFVFSFVPRAQRLGDARPAAPVPGVVAILHLVDRLAAVCGGGARRAGHRVPRPAWRPTRRSPPAWRLRRGRRAQPSPAPARADARGRDHRAARRVRRLSHRADLRPALRAVRQRPPRRGLGRRRQPLASRRHRGDRRSDRQRARLRPRGGVGARPGCAPTAACSPAWGTTTTSATARRW